MRSNWIDVKENGLPKSRGWYWIRSGCSLIPSAYIYWFENGEFWNSEAQEIPEKWPYSVQAYKPFEFEQPNLNKPTNPVDEWFKGLSVHRSPRPSVEIMACDKCGVGIYTDNSKNYHYIGKCLQAEESTETPSMPCSGCGNEQVYIRGQYPGYDNRLVCPQCVQERLEDLISAQGSPAAKENAKHKTA